MKKKQQTDEMLTDEEILERGASKTTENVLKFAVRPITVRTLSQMKRNGILDSEIDVFQRTAAFGFIHSSDKEEVDLVINDKAKFLNAVDDWMEENFNHHNELEPLAEVMNKAFEEYAAALSDGGSPYKGNGSKN